MRSAISFRPTPGLKRAYVRLMKRTVQLANGCIVLKSGQTHPHQYVSFYIRLNERNAAGWPPGNLRAQRLIWAVEQGRIPTGMVVCHSCDNPPCLNGAHYFLGSDLDNFEDMRAKGRHFNPEQKTRMSRLGWRHSEETKAEYRRVRKGKSYGPCPEERKQKISVALKGRALPEATRSKISAANKKYYANGGVHPMAGKVTPESVKEKIRAALKATFERKRNARNKL